jgi:isopenicillin N synthase-like dioxygenase
MRGTIPATGIWKVEQSQGLKEALIKAAARWDMFCELPDDVQDIFTSDDMFHGSGFERKTGIGGAKGRYSHDKKLNFDITARDIQSLEKKVRQIANVEHRKIARDFLTAVSQLPVIAQDAINTFGKTLETERGIPGFQELAQASAPNAFFRLLRYPPTQEIGEVIGEPHVDNSGFTLHLYESTDGCEALDSDGETWNPMPVAAGQALAFPSMQTQLFSKGKVEGLCHRILANGTTYKYGRTAIVCFIVLKDMPVYDRKGYGRLQDMTPGFNYGMNPDEFADLFVSKSV